MTYRPGVTEPTPPSAASQRREKGRKPESAKLENQPAGKVATWNKQNEIGIRIYWFDEYRQSGSGWTLSPAFVHQGLFAAVKVAGQELPVPIDWITHTDAGCRVFEEDDQ